MKNDFIVNEVNELRKFIRFKFGETATEKTYGSNVMAFLFYFADKVSRPQEINADMIVGYVNLPQFKTQASKRSVHSSIKFYYKWRCKNGESTKFRYIPYPEAAEYLPNPVTKEEFISLMRVCKNSKHRCILMLAFDCGMRVSEVVNLKIENVREDLMQIQIRNGKGRKDRYVKLSSVMLSFYKQYIEEYSPNEYVFNGQFDIKYSTRSCQELLETYRVKAWIKRKIKFHENRHGYAMSLLENGTDLNKIQYLLGHNSPKTTALYARMNNKVIQSQESPLEQIIKEKALQGVNQKQLLTA